MNMRLCIDTYTTSFTNGLDFDTVYKYKCKRCGKTKETLQVRDTVIKAEDMIEAL